MLFNTDTLIGFDCIFFQRINLADEVYMTMTINRFSLVKERHHHVHLPSIVEAFHFVKVLIAKKTDYNNSVGY